MKRSSQGGVEKTSIAHTITYKKYDICRVCYSLTICITSIKCTGTLLYIAVYLLSALNCTSSTIAGTSLSGFHKQTQTNAHIYIYVHDIKRRKHFLLRFTDGSCERTWDVVSTQVVAGSLANERNHIRTVLSEFVDYRQEIERY